METIYINYFKLTRRSNDCFLNITVILYNKIALILRIIKNNHHFGLKYRKNTSYKHYCLTKAVMNAFLGNFFFRDALAVEWSSKELVLPSLPFCSHCKIK